MERQLSLASGHAELGAHDVNTGVVGELEVVDARHDAGQIVVYVDVIIVAARLQRLAHDGKGRVETLQT